MAQIKLDLETLEAPSAGLSVTIDEDKMMATHKFGGEIINRAKRVGDLAVNDEICPYGPGTPIRRITGVTSV